MKFVWSRRAIGHLESLRDYIAKDKPGAARQVAQQIVECVEPLERHPLEIIAVCHGRHVWPK